VAAADASGQLVLLDGDGRILRRLRLPGTPQRLTVLNGQTVIAVDNQVLAIAPAGRHGR
jgi:Mrp family chromosome partitioning ATPase